jgi:hypothetical protein
VETKQSCQESLRMNLCQWDVAKHIEQMISSSEKEKLFTWLTKAPLDFSELILLRSMSPIELKIVNMEGTLAVIC